MVLGRRPQQLPRLGFVGGRGPAGQGAPRLLAEPRATRLLGVGRLHRGGVRRPLRRCRGVPDTAAARAFRREPGVSEGEPARRSTGAPRACCGSSRPPRAPRASCSSATERRECNLNHVVGGLRGCTGLTELGRRQVAVAGRPPLRERRAAGRDGPVLLGAATRAVETAERLRPVVGPGPRRSGRCFSAATCASCTRASATACPGRRWSRRSGYPTGTRDPGIPIAPGGESWSEFVVRASDAVRERRGPAPGGAGGRRRARRRDRGHA